jgi:signal transduction histidine kinase/CheY-like chemotaxis protein
MEGKMLLANPKTIKDYNLSNEDIGSYNILEYYASSSQRDEVLETLQKEGVVKEKIIKLKNYARGIDNIMVSILPIMYNHQNALLTIGVDLTQRLKIQEELSEAKKEAELANLSKSEFLANMSHEIRTPMNSVIGFSNLLDKLITDPIQKDYLSSIKRGGSALLDIINDILDLSKIEAGKLEIVLESVNIKQLVQEMESIFSVKLMQKNLNFEIEVDDSIPKYLLLDSARIRQILFNLLGNAIKFTDSGVIKLSVKKIFDDEKKSKVDLALIVEDSGMGIDAKNLENIFNSFEQQKGQSKKYGGTGLGLAICKKLLNFMNGSIEVESELGKGSKFTVYLREVSVSSIESEQRKPQLINENIEFNSASILVVDDIKDNRKLIKSALKDYGLNIYEAQNGKDALEKLKSIKIDLICMDIKMPIMDGYETIQIIKNNTLLKDIPVIAITASVMGKDMQKIKEYKFDGYLRKPVSYDELILTLTKFLTYNTYEIKTDKIDLGKQESYEDLPKTVRILDEVHTQEWKKIKDMGDFSLIEEFAVNLMDLANLHPNNLLLTYAKELKVNCESFDIERIDFMMNSFPNLVEKLKNILKKEKA